MVTVLRGDGLRVVIYMNDHLPAHVHVFGDGEIKINLCRVGVRPELVQVDSMTRSDIRRAMRIVTDRQAFLLQRWEDIHGRSE